MKSLHMRAAFVVIATLLTAYWPARAQAPYPNQAIKLVVPYAPGGLPDTVARIVGARLQERLGQSVVVENRPGAAGSVAVNTLLGAPPDGYTFLVTDGSTVTVNPVLFKQHPYSANDLVPVALLARAPLFLAVHEKIPVGTLKEFIDYVKARPGEINYGSSGVGSAHHLSMEALKSALHLNMNHIPYRGTGQSVPALLGGHVSVLFSAYPSLAGGIENKTIRLLATNGAARSPEAPEVPPLADVIPGFDLATMIGVFARPGTPPGIMQKIASETAAVVAMPETLKQFAVAGIEPAAQGADAFAKALSAEAAHVAKIIQAADIKVQ